MILPDLPRAIGSFIPRRNQRLRLLAHTRHIVAVMLPLGALVGFLVALALRGLGALEPRLAGHAGRSLAALVLPGAGLVLNALWLQRTGIGGVSLFKDLDLAHRDPYRVFPFLRSLGKVVGCVLTIGFGGSAGVEGPGKWFGAAVGLQYHRALRFLAGKASLVRHLARPAIVMVRGGAAAALAAVFRAPLSGALMAAEHEGRLSAGSTVPCLISAAAGYFLFTRVAGAEPLLPIPGPYPFALRGRELLWALVLGLVCGLAASLYLGARRRLGDLLGRFPLPLRALAAGVGLGLLALPSHLLWHDFPVTQGGGLDLVRQLVLGETLPQEAVAFLALKLLATALTFAGGGIGGLWLPSLAMGAAAGAAFDAWVGLGQTGYFTLIGAASVAGATHGTLLVPVVFLAETTGQTMLVVPALLGTTVAWLVAREGS
ncbi:MAG TPA: chloride channel protein [Holophaga sp.]|nr:chloride channel protein [Holophaga sp.]